LKSLELRLQHGDAVLPAAPKPEEVERALGQREDLFAVALDVTDTKQVQTADTAALKRFGQIYVLVNNAGRGLIGGVEETSAEEVRSVFAVSVEGLTRAVLPSMARGGLGAS
jgi:NAD(P)-dependent dehydrogenase (short-subunit alcohol dehydrogenase family)